ncbi:soluble lamin-associated protein of 75 kDa isoform X6 [Equus przewalskii]
MERNEIPFLCHSSTDYAKILWKKGEAIGFYSVKPTGSICASFLTQSYQLPVLDTMFVRKKYRGKDFGLHMLEDFVDSFTEDALGLRYPLSSLMYTACKQYFEKYPGDHELLWEVEGVGHWYQRMPVTRALQRETLKITVSQNEAKRPVSGEYGLASVPEYEAGTEDNQPSEMQLTIDSLKDAFASTSEGHDKTPVSTRTRSSQLKRPKIGKRFQDSEFSNSQGEDEKTPQTSPTASVNKLESTARTSESSEEFLEEEPEQSAIEFEDEGSDKEARPVPETQPPPDKQDGEKESELEPVNGEIVDDTLKTSLTTEEEDSASEVLDEELKLQSFSSGEDSAALVPLVVDSSKPAEAVAQEKTSHITDSEMLLEEGPADEKGHPEEKLPLVSRKKAHFGSSDSVAAIPNEERSDSGFPNSVMTEFSEESISENLSPNTTSSLEDQGEEAAPEPQEPAAALQQSSLIEVELEDVPFSQNAGQKNQSEEQSEASSEQLDQFTQSTEKTVDSSSEEIEVEVPVVDRRSLRRKAKGHKGPGKKKAKLT